MPKVSFFDKNIIKQYVIVVSGLLTLISLLIIFIDDEVFKNWWYLLYAVICLIILYCICWYVACTLTKVSLDIDKTSVDIITGDIFSQSGLKVIAFNEYFDTQVDDIIIAKNSLNGKFINNFFPNNVNTLDEFIKSYSFKPENVSSENHSRPVGKKQRYLLGTICVWNNEYLLTAFSRFNKHNEAVLTMPEYVSFLVKLWDEINSVYAQRSVSVPIIGSGITRIKEHKTISDEELLKIMLWTFRISETRFKHPAKLSIIIHESKIDQINLFEIKNMENGF